MQAPPPWYGALVGLAAAQRLQELAISRRRERRLTGVRACPRGYPVMVATHIGLFVLPSMEIAIRGRASRHPASWCCLLLGAFGLRWWSIRSLGPQWNVRALVPADLQPVATGPYRFIRHPNYLAVILEFVALPLAGGARASCLLLSGANAAVLACRIRSEEALLAQHPAYRRMLGHRRRLIPGVF